MPPSRWGRSAADGASSTPWADASPVCSPRSGFCAETGAAGAVLLATHLGLPVSTTHAIAGAIAGVGSIQRMKAVRWGIATNIVWAWVLTIPAAGHHRLLLLPGAARGDWGITVRMSRLARAFAGAALACLPAAALVSFRRPPGGDPCHRHRQKR